MAEGNDKVPGAQFRESVKKEVAQQAVKWFIALVMATLVIAGSGWWLYLKPMLVEITGGVPAGAVAAFDAPRDCPAGWRPFDDAAGRMIVGAGTGHGVSERRYREEGGEEAHVLTVEELPVHTHDVVEMIGDNNTDGVDSTTTRSGEHHNEPRRSGSTGGGRPHNNMPPYIALRYCKKE